MRPALVVVSVACVIGATARSALADEDPRGPEPPVMVLMPPPPEPDPEPAPPDPEPAPLSEAKLWDGGGEIAIGTLFFQPSLGGTVFEGGGTPLGGSHRESFRHSGRELGLDAPLMWGGELSIHYMRRYFAVGLMGFAAGNPGRSDRTPSPAYNAAASQVNTGALSGYGGGIDLAAALPLGAVAFRAGAVLGLRGFSMPMTGFEKKTCHTKRGSSPCSEDASTGAVLFFEPRARVEITLGRSLFLGGYVGMGVVGGSGPTVGLSFGLHTPHEKLQP